MTEDRRPRHGAPDYRADVRQIPGADAPPADAETARMEAPPSFDPSWPPRRDATIWPGGTEERAAQAHETAWTGDVPHQRPAGDWNAATGGETWAAPNGYAHPADGQQQDDGYDAYQQDGYPAGHDGYARNDTAYPAGPDGPAYSADPDGGAYPDGYGPNEAYAPDAGAHDGYGQNYDGYGRNEAYPAGLDGRDDPAGHDGYARNAAYGPGGEGYGHDADTFAPGADGYGTDAYGRAAEADTLAPGADGYGPGAHEGFGPEAEAYPRDDSGFERPGAGGPDRDGAGVGAYGQGAGGEPAENDPWVGRAGETALFAGEWAEPAGETGMIDLSAPPRAEPRSHREGSRRRAGVVALAAAGVFLAGAAGYIVLRPDSSPAPNNAAVATSAPVESPDPTLDAPVAEPTTTAPSASPAGTSTSPTTAAPTTEAATTTAPAAPVPVTTKPAATTPAARPTTTAPTKTLAPTPTTAPAAAPLTAAYGFSNGDDGYVGTVTVNNPGTAAATDWQVRLTIPSGASITVLSGGVSGSASGTRATFSGGSIGARSSLTFTFGLQTDSDDLPSGCTINGSPCS
ncbi:cellulose binding domain-containing protein [Actinoplanes sp. NPDC049596]|uniref:cellulose binding domain-containing protein n=1 Tax=unclassified Actinoplanes TaxID=2626549 RepID=UPI00342E58E9